jgi:hypothetical protein
LDSGARRLIYIHAVNAKLGKPTGVDWRRWYAYYDQARSG